MIYIDKPIWQRKTALVVTFWNSNGSVRVVSSVKIWLRYSTLDYLPVKVALPCNTATFWICKLLRLLDVVSENLGNPFPGSYSTLALSRAIRASFLRVIEASNDPLADDVSFRRATGCTLCCYEKNSIFSNLFQCIYHKLILSWYVIVIFYIDSRERFDQ